MMSSRSPLLSRTCRARIAHGRVSLGFSLALVLLGAVPGMAQMETKTAPSPVAPGDLSRPVFDTKTPVYDQVTRLDKSASTIVAEVEGRPITLGNVGDAIANLPLSMKQLPFDTLFPSVVDQLVKQQGLVVHAQQQGADEDPAIRRKVRQAADATLADEYIGRELTKKITEEALLARYNRDFAGKPGDEEARVRIIMSSSEKEAMDLIAEIRGGADFATIARRSSKDASAAAGGDVGFAPRDGLTPEVGAVAFSLAPGQMAAYPVPSVKAWFVVKCEERRFQPTPSFAMVRTQLVRTLLREAVPAAMEAALTDLKVRRYNISGKETEADKANAQ
jgi:peptidyl-prolyl cis-trans isomerase C